MFQMWLPFFSLFSNLLLCLRGSNQLQFLISPKSSQVLGAVMSGGSMRVGKQSVGCTVGEHRALTCIVKGNLVANQD